MSWFKRSPPKHPPHRIAQQPHRSSPASQKSMDEAKKTSPKDTLQNKSS
jgi:hypothetical protein